MLPIVTVPYIARVLNTDGVGVFSFTSSIVQFFILLGMLGIGTYGTRMIAMKRDNKVELSKTFFSIYFLQVLLTVTSIFFYILSLQLFNFERSVKTIAYLQVIALISSVFDCSWLFKGVEDFKKIVTRNIIVKLCSLIAIFIFVNEQDDLAIYTIIMGLSTLISQLIMWFYVKKVIMPVRIKISSLKKHIKPTIVFFLPEVAIQIYFVLNKTMLGFLSSNSQVGIYDYGEKIINIALAIVTAVGTIMLPRMANTYIKGDLPKAKFYLSKSLDFSTLLSAAIMFGIAGIATEFIPWFLGKDFYLTAKVIVILSPIIMLKAWSGVFGSQYFVPLGKMKQYSISLYSGAFVNIIINYIFIVKYGAIGAAIGTLAAETVVTVIQFFLMRKIVRFKKLLFKLTYYLISGFIMFIIIRFIGDLLGVGPSTTIIQIFVGAITYFLIVFLIEVIIKDGLVLDEAKKILKIKCKRQT